MHSKRQLQNENSFSIGRTHNLWTRYPTSYPFATDKIDGKILNERFAHVLYEDRKLNTL